MNAPDDTIAAICTAPGEAGISIVRVAGPQALAIGDSMFRCRGATPSERAPMTFVHGFTHDDEGDVDEALLLVMHGPHSYTGEDTIEIQGHGGELSSRRNLRVVLEAGARLAEPGEFTRRAFLNGRIDLLQAEAVLDLIKARSDRAADVAIGQLDGSLSSSLNGLYDDVVAVTSDLEATLDFPEDELPPTVMPEIRLRLSDAQRQFDVLISTWDEGHALREGARVVIAGSPNVGKSTLLNALLGRDRAIVSGTPGTTRDSIEESFVMEGVPLTIVDTAGLRETNDEVETEGIRRARRHLEHADMYLVVVDVSLALDEDTAGLLASIPRHRCIVVLNKSDLGSVLDRGVVAGIRSVSTSLTRLTGMDELRSCMAGLLREEILKSVGQGSAVSERHRGILLSAREQLEEADKLLGSGREDLVVPAAGRLREALEQVGEVTGRAYHEELLNSIFSRFCIGK